MAEKEFNHSRDVLSAKLKELKSLGMGTKKRRADPFTVDEINMLYEKQLFGAGNYIFINEIHILTSETLFGQKYI